MQNIEQRVQQLEQQLKWYKQLSVWSLCAVLFILLLSANLLKDNVQEMVKAKKFILVNDDGKQLMRIEPGESAAAFNLFDVNGQELVYLGADGKGNGGLVEVSDRAGKNLMQLRTNQQGAAIKLYNELQQNVVLIGEDRENRGAGFINIGKNGSRKIIINGHQSKIYIADEKSKSGFYELPQKQ